MPVREPLDVLDAIQSTRAQRYLKPDAIPEPILWEILDAAVRGPTGGNKQGWAWIVIRDSEIKREIGRVYEERLKSIYGYERVSDEALGSGRITRGGVQVGEVGLDARNRRGVIHLADHLAEVPVIVAPVIENAAAGEDTRQAGAHLGSSIYGAVQNLMLAARAFEIGSVFTWYLDETSGFNGLLGMPESARVMCLIPLGYLAQGSFSQPRRRPLSEVVHWDGWGKQVARPDA
ncbi:MAG: nitroreductase family protein [Deltaproteobacteria bacterium]|nr:nitroreductase family protein [Deltaproteobacteria bacterium]MBW2361835.1 nitroreductase family protein [Deltaproteobacteria bacterium]